jgi:hypothetical protein
MGLPRATVNKTPLRTEEAAADNEQQVYGSCPSILRIILQPEHQVVYQRSPRREGKCHGRHPPFS